MEKGRHGTKMGDTVLRAESNFRRVKGYKEIPQLLAFLHKKSIDKKEVAA